MLLGNDSLVFSVIDSEVLIGIAHWKEIVWFHFYI